MSAGLERKAESEQIRKRARIHRKNSQDKPKERGQTKIEQNENKQQQEIRETKGASVAEVIKLRIFVDSACFRRWHS